MSQTQKISGVATRVFTDESGARCVQYHKTIVWKRSADGKTITLNTGGWKTVTTKLRMNQAFSQFGYTFRVYQDKGDWFISHMGNLFVAFDGDTLVLNVA